MSMIIKVLSSEPGIRVNLYLIEKKLRSALAAKNAFRLSHDV